MQVEKLFPMPLNSLSYVLLGFSFQIYCTYPLATQVKLEGFCGCVASCFDSFWVLFHPGSRNLIHAESAFLLLIKPCMDQPNGSGVNLCPRTLSLIAPLTKIKKQITRSSGEANSMFTHSR